MKFPSDIKPKDVVRTLEKFGFQRYKSKGSHLYFRHPDGRWTQVAVHPKPIPMGTLRKILNQAEIAPEDFLKRL
ncbi:MAG: type II toxin-antitoxin system HicA family toxin [Patescibacteria group bacterium]